jgi:hypothetical protein
MGREWLSQLTNSFYIIMMMGLDLFTEYMYEHKGD